MLLMSFKCSLLIIAPLTYVLAKLNCNTLIKLKDTLVLLTNALANLTTHV
jgi:hypothetical protein